MAYPFEEGSNKLVFELKNSAPIELSDLTRSLTAVANQYRRFVIREELHEETEAKLYVKEVRDGSTIVELFSYVAEHSKEIGSVIATSTSVIGFGVYLKKSFGELLGGKKPDFNYTAKDISDLSKILGSKPNQPLELMRGS